MDAKTLQWMSERVIRSNEINGKIEDIQTIVTLLKKGTRIVVAGKYQDVAISKRGGEGREEPLYLLEIEAHMINVAIDLYQAEIIRLQAEFDLI